MRFVIQVIATPGGAAAYTQALQDAGVLLEACGRCWTIEVKSKAEAAVWASRCPVAAGEVVEVVQV